MSHGRWALAGTARVATRAIETIASPAIWLSRIACLCSRLLNHRGRGENGRLRWIPRPQRPRDADNLAVADRSEIPAFEGIGMGLDDEEMAFEEPRSALPERQRTAFAIMIEGLGGDRAIDVYNACGPADLVVAHGNHAPERHAAGRTLWFARSFLRVADGRTTTMSRRDGVRFSTP
jgi:hypothetical protein